MRLDPLLARATEQHARQSHEECDGRDDCRYVEQTEVPRQVLDREGADDQADHCRDVYVTDGAVPSGTLRYSDDECSRTDGDEGAVWISL